MKVARTIENDVLVPLPCVAETFDRISYPTSYAIGDSEVRTAHQKMMGSVEHAKIPEGNVGYSGFVRL